MKYHYCFLEKFNNYFNRKIIMFSSLEDYQNNSKDFFIPFIKGTENYAPMDFNPNDNVMTEIIGNNVPFSPDYILIFDEDNNIVSRWFILEEKRNRQGQWTYTLRRDVISDHIDTLYDAPIFVQKGMLQQDDPFIVNSEGMNFNQVKVNEVKLSDRTDTGWLVGYMARNSSGTDINIQVASEEIVKDYVTLEEIASEIGTTSGILNDLINFEDDTSNKARFTYEVAFRFGIRYVGAGIQATQSFYYYFDSTLSNGNRYNMPTPTSDLFHTLSNLNNVNDTRVKFIEAVYNNKVSLLSQMPSILGRDYFFNEQQLEMLKGHIGDTIKYNGKFYKLNIRELPSTSSSSYLVSNQAHTSLRSLAEDTISLSTDINLTIGDYSPDAPRQFVYDEIKSSEKEIVISLQYISDSETIPQVSTVISSGRNITGDQEYDIFAIPLSIYLDNSGESIDPNPELVRRIASAIALEQDAQVYDLQLLPYCPVQNLISDYKTIDVGNLTEHKDFEYISKNVSMTKYLSIPYDDITFTLDGAVYHASGTATLLMPAGATPTIEQVLVEGTYEDLVTNIQYNVVGDQITVTFDVPSDVYTGDFYISIYYHNTLETTVVGIMFYVQQSSFQFFIDYKVTGYFGPNQLNTSDKKILSNCTMHRLVSPNYQGAFEFNLAKNGGTVEGFNVFCTYKAYTPFIKVAPNFSWLYGTEYKDNRGLICAGDFSIARVKSEWESYQLQNKNYQNIFNRDIQHLDFMQSIEMRNQLVSGAVGILTDTAKGAGAGAYVGGVAGGVIGGALGGATSAIGYGVDVDTLARTQRENKQLAIDKFNYQLGNIKALPYTITTVGAFNVISKIFPFLEYYVCTGEEAIAFQKKIQYESMTVMRIGTLREFMNFDEDLHYFKGELIRNDEIADDTHVVNAIYEELLKGVYI